MNFFLHDSMPIMHLDIHANMSPTKTIVDNTSTHFVRVTKIKTAAKIMMVKRLARNNLLIKLIQNEDGFFETKKNNKNKKSFIGFKSVAYLSSIKTRFNRSVARTVLFFASYFYTFTGLRMQCIRLFSVFFGTARCATDSLQLYAIRKMYIAEHQISLKLSE